MYTVATVASRFRLALSPFVRCACGGWVVGRPPHHDPFLVRAGHHDLSFLLRLRPVEHERRGRLGHFLVQVLQAIHRLLQPQEPPHGGAGLPERLRHAQRLVPVLQQVREDAFRKLQPIVQRHEVALLFLPAAVHDTPQRKRAEDGDVTAFMQVLEPVPRLTRGQRHGFAHVPVTLQPEKLSQALVPELPHPLPQAPLDLVHGPALTGGRSDKLLPLQELLLQQFALENVLLVCHAQRGSP
jgi:hypothetical protein